MNGEFIAHKKHKGGPPKVCRTMDILPKSDPKYQILSPTGIRHDLRTGQTPGPKNNVGIGDHLVLCSWGLGQKINIVIGARGCP